MSADPVVIALDGSTPSAQALRWGLDEAAFRGADVLLARANCAPRKGAARRRRRLVGEDPGLDPEGEEYLAEQLERASARHPTVTIDTRLLHGPDVPDLPQLSGVAQLLVIGSRGHAGRAWIGSFRGHLAARAHCPVVVVPTGGGESPAPDAPVVVGVDGSSASFAVARIAAREASLRKVQLVGVHAHPTAAGTYGRRMPALARLPEYGIDESSPTHRTIKDMTDRLRGEYPGLHVHFKFVDDEPVHALVVAACNAQLLVVGSRGLGTFGGMLLGAVSNAVVRDGTCTVLVMHDGTIG